MCTSAPLTPENTSPSHNLHKAKSRGKPSSQYKSIYVDNLKVAFCLFLECNVTTSKLLENCGPLKTIMILDVI